MMWNLKPDSLDALIRSKMFKNSSGTWQCTDCDHISQHTTNMKNHIEVKHVGSSGYYCQQCNKLCTTRNALNSHRTRYRHWISRFSLFDFCFSANNLCNFVAGDENLERYQVEALELEICKHMSHHEDNTWSCIHCQYTSGSKAPMMAHIESKHMMSSGIICSVCDKICRTRNALNIHKTRYHKSK